MTNDDELLTDVVEALKLDPAVDSSHIAAALEEGVVSINGSVPSYWQKVAAEDAVRRVMGVRAVANDVTVEPPDTHARSDTDIAAAAAAALSWHSELPSTLQVTVSNGWVRLTGDVDRPYQRTVAENAVRQLRGIKGVTNGIGLTVAADSAAAATADYDGDAASAQPVSWAALNVILEQIHRRLIALEEKLH